MKLVLHLLASRDRITLVNDGKVITTRVISTTAPRRAHGRSDRRERTIGRGYLRRSTVRMAAKDVVRKLVDAQNRHDAGAISALYSQDAVSHSPNLRSRQEDGRQARERRQKSLEGWFGAFPDFEFKVSNLVAGAGEGWFEFVFTGTHKGTFQTSKGPIPPTNKVVEWRGAWFVRTRGILIVEESRFYDLGEWMAQLGLEP